MPDHSTPLTSAQRLAAIKAERAALSTQFTAMQADGAEAAELAAEELKLANEKALMATTIKLGPIGEKWAALNTRLGLVIVKRATDSHFKAYQEDPKFSFEATDAFVRRCVEYPTIGQYDAIIKELPGLVVDLSIEINKLMGVLAAERVKK